MYWPLTRFSGSAPCIDMLWIVYIAFTCQRTSSIIINRDITDAAASVGVYNVYSQQSTCTIHNVYIYTDTIQVCFPYLSKQWDIANIHYTYTTDPFTLYILEYFQYVAKFEQLFFV